MAAVSKELVESSRTTNWILIGFLHQCTFDNEKRLLTQTNSRSGEYNQRAFWLTIPDSQSQATSNIWVTVMNASISRG